MAGTVSISFTASAGGFTVGSRSFGPPAEIATADFKLREPAAWAAANEFLVNGTTSGSVTVQAS